MSEIPRQRIILKFQTPHFNEHSLKKILHYEMSYYQNIIFRFQFARENKDF